MKSAWRLKDAVGTADGTIRISIPMSSSASYVTKSVKMQSFRFLTAASIGRRTSKNAFALRMP